MILVILGSADCLAGSVKLIIIWRGENSINTSRLLQYCSSVCFYVPDKISLYRIQKKKKSTWKINADSACKLYLKKDNFLLLSEYVWKPCYLMEYCFALIALHIAVT